MATETAERQTIRQAISAGLPSHDEETMLNHSEFLVAGVRVDCAAFGVGYPTGPEEWTVQIMGRERSWNRAVYERYENDHVDAGKCNESEGERDVVTLKYGIEFDPEDSDWWWEVAEAVKKKRGVDRIVLGVGFGVWVNGYALYPGDEHLPVPVTPAEVRACQVAGLTIGIVEWVLVGGCA
jgi:hypothetical protein